MNRQMQPQWSITGIVEAPPDRVWEGLLDAFAALYHTELRQESNPETFKKMIGNQGEGRISLEVDKKHYHVALQGEWWYRGVYAISPHPQGSLLLYQVYNIAPGASRWFAQLFQGPAHAQQMGQQFQSLLYTLGDQLGCGFSPANKQVGFPLS
jgi:hypothetical protein